MFKLFSVTVLILGLSQGAIADSKTKIFQCSFSLKNQAQFIKGLSLDLDVSADSANQYMGTWTVLCDICKRTPAEFPLHGKIATLSANFDGVLDGGTIKLDIPLESFAPTKKHQAQLTYPSINDGVPLDGTCTDVR